MNYLQKQATIKLAQTRLAINYVLRNRYMNKLAETPERDYEAENEELRQLLNDPMMYEEVDMDNMWGPTEPAPPVQQPQQPVYIPEPGPGDPGFVPAPTATPAPLPPEPSPFVSYPQTNTRTLPAQSSRYAPAPTMKQAPSQLRPSRNAQRVARNSFNNPTRIRPVNNNRMYSR